MERIPEFLANHPLLTILFFGLLAALIWTEIARRMRPYIELSPADLTRLINREEPAIIDVSAIADFDKGHIIGSRQLTPSQVDPNSKELAKLRDKPVVVVCRSGATAAAVATRLAKAGFTRVHWLAGGIAAWTAANLPLEKGRGKTRG